MIKKVIVAALMLISSQEMLALKIDGNHIKDNHGNSIEIKEYNKLIVLDPAVVETIYLLGGDSSHWKNCNEQDIPRGENKRFGKCRKYSKTKS